VPAAGDLANLTAQVAFLGVPFDGGTPQPGNKTGQKLGPAAARHASWEQFTYGEDGAAGWYDIESDCDRLQGVTMADVLLIEAPPDDPRRVHGHDGAGIDVGRDDARCRDDSAVTDSHTWEHERAVA
jgi:arginase family enzyme